ncbi:hypothetical protein [Actinoplanes subglobosus]|uniref:Secreted peptide n=1 Tax=Actinoplanes subglobosus TaxID=1547892 RepID=A0ABV8IP54_9ACTN
MVVPVPVPVLVVPVLVPVVLVLVPVVLVLVPVVLVLVRSRPGCHQLASRWAFCLGRQAHPIQPLCELIPAIAAASAPKVPIVGVHRRCVRQRQVPTKPSRVPATVDDPGRN